MVLLFSDLDALVPSVELLVHSHCLFDFVVLDQNCFGFTELFVQNGEFGLNSEVVNSFLSDELVDLSKIVSFRDVSKSSIASLSNIKILLLKSHLGNCLPVSLRLWSKLEWLENLDSSLQSIVLKSSSKLNKSLIKIVSHSVGSIIHQDLCLAFSSLDGFNISLDLVHGDLVSLLNTVPDAEIVPVLSHNDI
jgi:hypothetical protein